MESIVATFTVLYSTSLILLKFDILPFFYENPVCMYIYNLLHCKSRCWKWPPPAHRLLHFESTETLGTH